MRLFESCLISKNNKNLHNNDVERDWERLGEGLGGRNNITVQAVMCSVWCDIIFLFVFVILFTTYIPSVETCWDHISPCVYPDPEYLKYLPVREETVSVVLIYKIYIRVLNIIMIATPSPLPRTSQQYQHHPRRD